MARPDNRKSSQSSHRRASQPAIRIDASRSANSRDSAEKKAEQQDRAIFRALGLLDETGRRAAR